jgi:hypothetical protein
VLENCEYPYSFLAATLNSYVKPGVNEVTR